jgi:hypothetical protein
VVELLLNQALKQLFLQTNGWYRFLQGPESLLAASLQGVQLPKYFGKISASGVGF